LRLSGEAPEPAEPGWPAAAASTAFEPGVQKWIGVLGRLRDVVRQEVLAAQLASLPQLAGRPARVLDVGCGQGTQALRLARAGHQVTGLDASAELLGRCRAALAGESPDVAARVALIHGPGERAPELTPGPFDAVLCHGVLMYLDDEAPMLAALTAVTAPGAVLSLLVRNGMATAMRDGLRGNWAAALAAFDTACYVNRLGLPAHAHTPDVLDRMLEPLGWRREAWFGVRIFTDHLDQPPPARPERDALLAAELEAGRRDPYRGVAALLHLTYARPDG
jgi:S-adenosylmethionine-dependent methyltransferase